MSNSSIIYPPPATSVPPSVLVESGLSAKISAMAAAGALSGTEEVLMVQSGVDKIATAQSIANLAPAPTPSLLVESGLSAKISALTAATGMLNATLDIVQGGVNKKAAYTLLNFWANVRDYGAVGDGVTDDRPAFVLAIATGKPVYVPPGTYLLSAYIQLQQNQHLFGDGVTSILKVTGNIRTVSVDIGVNISWLKMIGSGKNSGQNFQTGVFASNAVLSNDAVRWTVSHCWFEDFGGNPGANGGGGIYCSSISGANSDGAQIISCRANNCNAGFNFGERSEYMSIVGCSAGGCNTGFASNSGNMMVTAYIAQSNGKNLVLGSGTNNGHSTFSACECNHGVTSNLEITGQTMGYSFNGCNFYDGSVSIDSSVGIKFVGGDLVGAGAGGGETLNITGNSTVLISSCRFPTLGGGSGRELILTVQAGSTLTQANNMDF